MPTLRDVADSAGVSASTASRALANSTLVNAETRRRVQAAAERLEYLPNRAARSLITGRSGNLGVLMPDMANPYFAVIAKEIQAWSQQRDLVMLFADSDEHPRAELELIRVMNQQVDGLVLCSPRSPADTIQRACGTRPTVVVNGRVEPYGSVVFDNASGVEQALRHLAELGHRWVAWIPGPLNSRSSAERTAALARLGPRIGVEIEVLSRCSPTYEGGRAAAQDVLAAGVTAVIGYNDLVALGVLNAFATMGVGVPEQISVVGIDNITMSEMVHPALTTVSCEKERAGRVAVEMLERVLDGDAPSHIELPCTLLIRASTGPVPHQPPR